MLASYRSLLRKKSVWLIAKGSKRYLFEAHMFIPECDFINTKDDPHKVEKEKRFFPTLFLTGIKILPLGNVHSSVDSENFARKIDYLVIALHLSGK